MILNVSRQKNFENRWRRLKTVIPHRSVERNTRRRHAQRVTTSCVWTHDESALPLRQMLRGGVNRWVYFSYRRRFYRLTYPTILPVSVRPDFFEGQGWVRNPHCQQSFYGPKAISNSLLVRRHTLLLRMSGMTSEYWDNCFAYSSKTTLNSITLALSNLIDLDSRHDRSTVIWNSIQL